MFNKMISDAIYFQDQQIYGLPQFFSFWHFHFVPKKVYLRKEPQLSDKETYNDEKTNSQPWATRYNFLFFNFFFNPRIIFTNVTHFSLRTVPVWREVKMKLKMDLQSKQSVRLEKRFISFEYGSLT